MMRRIALLCLAVFLFVAPDFDDQRTFVKVPVADFEEIDEYVRTKMKELQIPGAALVIVQGDEIVHLEAFGVADSAGRPVTPQTPFLTGSTGKSFTALAILQLVEAGKIELDAPVQTYLPWFHVADNADSESITVRHLLHQVSGLPGSIGRTQLANTDLSDAAIENNVRALAAVDLIAPPGERYEYSNANYVTLGMIIQAVTGQTYEAYIRENIYLALDMQHSFTSKTEAQQDGLAVGYQKWFGIPVAAPDLPYARGLVPAGLLAMSAEDFGHYLIAQLNNGTYQGVSVLSPAGIAALHHPEVPIPGSANYYAMGWEVQQFLDVEVLRHNGQIPGYTADMFLVPQNDIAVAMLMNTFSPMLGIRVARLPANVLRMLLDQDLIPGNEIGQFQLVYGLVMSLPLLNLLAVLTFLRRFRARHSSRELPSTFRRILEIALPLVCNSALAYATLVYLPASFEADIPTMILFQPDVGWIAVVSGIFAIVWGLVSTCLGISLSRPSIS